jgi:hypothetical protein
MTSDVMSTPLDQNTHLKALFYLEKRKTLALVSRAPVTVA